MLTLFSRLLKLPPKHSYFLFGARNTGKSTLVKKIYPTESSLLIDLLKKETERRFTRSPDDLYDIVLALPEAITHVIIDEIQKVPELLDVVHRLIANEECHLCFVMTGSSARKLKKGGANLLAGRAYVYHLYPLTHKELGDDFNLQQVLQWGSLPDVIHSENDEDRSEFLHAYAHTYLKEEIWDEQVVKNLDPFRRFLEVAAQCNGKIINYSNIARDVGVSDKTIRNYFTVLEDTLVGFFLEPYQGSFRKRLGKQPKFYMFDLGVTRALAFLTDVKLAKQTNAYGNAFEHFIIAECIRLSEYYRLRYRFSYLRTHNDLEIDLIVERPGKNLLLIEIKSTEQVHKGMLTRFINIYKEIPHAEAICISNEEYARKVDEILILPWQIALARYFVSA